MTITKRGKLIFTATSILYFLIVLIYEIFYCNFNFVTGITGKYCFSLYRLMIYILVYIAYLYFSKKKINSISESFDNKIKTIFTGIICMTLNIVFIIIISFILSSKSILMSQVISMLAILLFDIFLIYITDDFLKDTILICLTFGIIFSITTRINNQLDEKKHFLSAYSLSLGNFSNTKHTVDTSIADIRKRP